MKTLLFAITCFLLVDLAFSQSGYFGQNKVQYSKFSWHYLQSDHFDVYFDKENKYLAEFTAEVAESALVSYRKIFRYELESRIPIIVYRSHNSFQQTNVVYGYLEEGIGGVTELFKNRVVVPFEGDYAKFRHVIRHELVHAVINEMFYGGSIQAVVTRRISLKLPLWFNEGLAEYAALEGWDTNSDMFMRDAAISKYLPSRIDRLQGYFAYRGGQSLWWYISRKYGKEKVGEIIRNVKSSGSVEDGFKKSIGLNLEELAERWQWDQQKLYWPDVDIRDQVSDYAKPLTNHKKDGSFYNAGPAISPHGNRVVFMSNRDGYFGVYLMNITSREIVAKLATGGKTNDFEELHLLSPGLSWSPDEKFVALATKAGAEDAIMLLSVENGAESKLTLGLDGVFSVAWSRRGNKLAFVGNKGSQSDIYVYDLKSRELVNVTDDIASDSDPVWSPNGESIYFSSDRDSLSHVSDSTNRLIHKFKDKDLYCVSLASGTVKPVIGWEGSDEISPVASFDGKKLLFISDRNGIGNIYEWNSETAQVRPITNSLSGVNQLSLSYDDTRLSFASFAEGGYNIFVMRNPFSEHLDTESLKPTWFTEHKRSEFISASESNSVPKEPVVESHDMIFGTARNDSSRDLSVFEKNINPDSVKVKEAVTDNKEADGSYKAKKYKLSFSPDLVYGNTGYNTFYGVYGFTVLAFSDMLGDHKIFLMTNLQLDLKNSDYGLSYYYLGDRVNYGIAAFHTARFIPLWNEYGGSWYRLRVWNLSGLASYPLDRFNRADFSLGWYDISKTNLEILEPTDKRTALVPAVSYVHDNSLWGFTGPVNGSRYSLSLAASPPLGSKGLSFVNAGFDYRNYLNIANYYTFALRFAGGGSFGRNPQRFVIGGVESWINYSVDGGYIPIEKAEDLVFMELGVPLRGYNYNAASGSRYGLLNLEFRYPMLGFLQLSTLPIWLQSFGGSFFFDAGTAWSRERDLQLLQRTESEGLKTRDLLMGMGTGTRIYFMGFLVRLDVAWSWNFDSFSKPKYYLSLGADF